jgi:hypothetical protein
LSVSGWLHDCISQRHGSSVGGRFTGVPIFLPVRCGSRNGCAFDERLPLWGLRLLPALSPARQPKQQGLPQPTGFSPGDRYVPLSRRGPGSARRDAQTLPGGRDLLATGCDASGREAIRPGRQILRGTGRVSFPCCQIREGSARAHRVPSALIASSLLFPSGVCRESSLALLRRPLSVA